MSRHQAVRVTFARGAKDDVANLTTGEDPIGEKKALGRRIAELLLECEANPYAGDLMGSGRHPELAGCRRIRFDVPERPGKPRLRLIYRNEPSDGAR